MKALTLTQPWASLIPRGAKRIETRSWGTTYRGPLAIHAAKGFPRWAQDLCFQPTFTRALWPDEPHDMTPQEIAQLVAELPRGAMVAVAVLPLVRSIDIALRAEVLAQTLTPNEIEFGDYTSGRSAWFLEDVKPLAEPIPCKGALGLWDVPQEVRAQILM
jgi:hypothetical protein